MQTEKQKLTKTSNEFLGEVRELRQLEEQKRKEPLSTDRFHELAETITDKSRSIIWTAVLQEDLGNQTETGDVSIEDVAPPDGNSPER